MDTHSRIGRIKLKSGGELRLLRNPRDNRRLHVEQRIKACLDALEADGIRLAGFSFVAWNAAASSWADCAGGGGIPPSLIPDFVRNRLLGEIIEEWASDYTLQRLGYQP